MTHKLCVKDRVPFRKRLDFKACLYKSYIICIIVLGFRESSGDRTIDLDCENGKRCLFDNNCGRQGTCEILENELHG